MLTSPRVRRSVRPSIRLARRHSSRTRRVLSSATARTMRRRPARGQRLAAGLDLQMPALQISRRVDPRRRRSVATRRRGRRAVNVSLNGRDLSTPRPCRSDAIAHSVRH